MQCFKPFIFQMEIMREIKGLIFDMDGVVVDSEGLHFEVEREIFRRFGINVPESIWPGFRGKTLREFFDYVIENYCTTPITVEEMIAAKDKLYTKELQNQARFVPGSKELLEELKSRKIPLAIATSSRRIYQETVFRVLGLEGIFSVVMTADDIINGKPDPEIFLRAASALDLESYKCAVVEDAVSGIQAAKRAACYAVGLTTSFTREELLHAGADTVIDQPGELLQIIS